MDDITVRKAESCEMESVRELFETVFKETFSDNVPAFEEETAGEKIYVALLDNKIVGMASVWEPDNFIHYLFVAPAFRNKNIGNTLVVRLAKLYGSPLTLKCLLKNVKAMSFYRFTGWQEIETGVCEDGEYALLCYNVLSK